jgi:hypothetical protein
MEIRLGDGCLMAKARFAEARPGFVLSVNNAVRLRQLM